MLRARRNEKDLKVKPATSFNYFQYLLTENLKQTSRQKKYYLQYLSPSEYFSKQIPSKVSDPTI